MKTKRNQAKMVMEDLAETAMFHKLLNATNRSAKPGELIQGLGPVKRQILKNLTSDDIKDVRWPL
jgi:hypothetical protein